MKAITLAALLAAAPLASHATTIDFTTLPDSTIDQSYGDIAGVLDVVYEYSYDGGVTFTQGGRIWPLGYYGGQSNTNALIAPAGGASIMQITLNALGGNTLTSFGAAVAYWTAVDAFDLNILLRPNTGTPYAFSNSGFGGLTGVGLSGGYWTSAVLQLGADWNVGYQSVSYQLDGTVPLPGAAFLLVGALAGLGLMRRRKAA